MVHRDRVLAALAHETTDHPPFQASFVPEFAARLREHLGLSGANGPFELERATGQDILQTGVGWATNYYRQDTPYTDDWGVTWRIDRYATPFGEGFYTNIGTSPLAGDNPDLAAYHTPDPNDPRLYTSAERVIRDFGSEFFIVGNVHCTVFETAWALRGFENLLIDLVTDPGLAEQIIDLPYLYHREVVRNLAERGVDMIWLGDDWGMETNLLISLDVWRRFFKPRYADICATIKKANPKCRIAFHSDGAVTKLIPDLIDVGVEVLNPIQTDCMDPAQIQREFGDHLSFFGGIAVQSTLPYGTPADIAAEFDWLKSTLGADGGWICAPTHNVQLDTPIENLLPLVRCATGE
jgi:uroporphyrinogen decarboxylase